MSTLKEVATLAGVSLATASLALNGKPVNERTRKLVLQCAKQLGYVPNRSGRTLITGKTNIIHMVILNSVRYANLVVDTTFFYNYIEGVLEAAGEHSYSVTFDVKNWEDEDLSDYFYRKIHGHAVDGLIIIPQYTRELSFLEVIKDFPFVLLNSHLKDPGILSFDVNNYAGGSLVASYMRSCRFKQVAFINGPEEHYDASQRRRGFFDTLQDERIHISQYNGDWTGRSGYHAAEKIFSSSKVDAVFCGNDFMASGVLRYLYQHSISVPNEVSLIGYDDIGLASALYPRLTTVDGRLPEIGYGLGKKLLSRMGVCSYPEDTILEPRFVVRESSIPNV